MNYHASDHTTAPYAWCDCCGATLDHAAALCPSCLGHWPPCYEVPASRYCFSDAQHRAYAEYKRETAPADGEGVQAAVNNPQH